MKTFPHVCLMLAALTGSLPAIGGLVPVQFGAATNFYVGGSPRALIVGDFTKDGKPDVAVAVSSDLILFSGSGDGALASLSTNHAP